MCSDCIVSGRGKTSDGSTAANGEHRDSCQNSISWEDVYAAPVEEASLNTAMTSRR